MNSSIVRGALGLAVLAGCRSAPLPKVPGVSGWDQVEHGRSLGAMRLKPAVCASTDERADVETLDESALVHFLAARGFPTRIERARADLVYVDVPTDPQRPERWVRLRVAILQSPIQAGQELHRAVLEQGNGSWGVHRSNLAVLAPVGELENILAFNGKTGLACWGVLTIAGGHDGFVVPGGYREL